MESTNISTQTEQPMVISSQIEGPSEEQQVMLYPSYTETVQQSSLQAEVVATSCSATTDVVAAAPIPSLPFKRM